MKWKAKVAISCSFMGSPMVVVFTMLTDDKELLDPFLHGTIKRECNLNFGNAHVIDAYIQNRDTGEKFPFVNHLS